MFGFSRRQGSILHLTWIAFFVTFVAWFNMAPFNVTLMKTMGLSGEQIKTLIICNVALTIPARIAIGSLVDLYGPRKVYSLILLFASGVCLQFAMAETFLDLVFSRLSMSVVGAGFVVGIKVISEWFPSEKMGIAQGIYGGWGNFGAAAAAFALPMIAALFPSETGWRAAAMFSGSLCLIWSGVFFRFAQDSPDGKTHFKAALDSRLEVFDNKGLILLVLIQVPVYATMAALAWKLSGHPYQLLPSSMTFLLYEIIGGVFVWRVWSAISFNIKRLTKSPPKEKRYEFSQIAILSLVYSLTFGSELAVISIFPQFLETLYDLTVVQAGWFGSSFAFMNLIIRPSGGWFSDKIGRKKSLIILTAGAMIIYGMMSRIGPGWPLASTLSLAILCSLFLQAGNGACFAMVPLIRRDFSGKMAGLAGAYGNVGSAIFLIVFSFVEIKLFFKILAGYAVIIFGISTTFPSFSPVLRSNKKTTSNKQGN